MTDPSPQGASAAPGPPSKPGPLPWNTEDPLAAKWTDSAYDALVAGALTAKVSIKGAAMLAYLDGPCPRCEHPLSQRDLIVSLVATGVLGGGTEEKVPKTVDVTFTCDCSEAHPGRPDTEPAGCNTHFRLLVFEEKIR